MEKADKIEEFFDMVEKFDQDYRERIFRDLAENYSREHDDLGFTEVYDKLQTGYNMHIELKAINNQITGILGTIKMMVNGFTPKEGVAGLSENITFFHRFWVIGVAPLTSLQENMEAFKKKYIE